MHSIMPPKLCKHLVVDSSLISVCAGALGIIRDVVKTRCTQPKEQSKEICGLTKNVMCM